MENTITYKPVLHNGQKRILVIFALDAEILSNLRRNTDATWSKSLRSWHIADTNAHRIKYNITTENKTSPKIESHLPNKNKDFVKPILIETQNATHINNKLEKVNLKPIKTKCKEIRIGIFFSSNNLIDNNIKKISGIKWCEINICWHLPCTQNNYNELCTILKDTATINNKSLVTYLRKRKAGLNLNKQLDNKVRAIPEKAFKISDHNMLLLQRTVEELQLKAYSTSTLRTYKNEIGIFLQTIKNKKANTLSVEDVRRYIHYCINKLMLSENTIHSRLNALKFLYEQVLGNDKFFVEIPRPKKHLQLPKVLGEQELRRLFAAPKNLKHKAILFIAYSAGLRVSEVINLRLQDIDRERQQLFIHCSKGKKDRYVRLSPMVLDVLEQYYKMSEIKPKNYLFEGSTKGEPYSIRSAQQIFNDARKNAGILKSLSFHNLRHSFATHLLEKGVDVVFIKDILGHFDIRTTERYLHVRRDTLINIESPIEDLYKRRNSI